MPRRIEKFHQGQYYHLYNRVITGCQLFYTPPNYHLCTELLAKYSQKYETAVIAYCLMPDHYHFLLRQDGDISLSKLISVLFSQYVQKINHEQRRSGPLFKERFQHKTVNTQTYLLHLCRYIHANPVKAGLVESLFHWPYSNIHEWAGLYPEGIYDPQFVAQYFPKPTEYIRFVTAPGWFRWG